MTMRVPSVQGSRGDTQTLWSKGTSHMIHRCGTQGRKGKTKEENNRTDVDGVVRDFDGKVIVL